MPCTKLHDAPDMHEYCFVPCDPAASFSWISSSAVSVLTFLQGAGPALWGDRPCATYSLRQNNGFAKGVAANSPLCFHAPKNFQKFCAVSPSFFFLSTTYGLSIFSAKSSNRLCPKRRTFLPGSEDDLCRGGPGGTDEVRRSTAHLGADAPTGNIHFFLCEDALVEHGSCTASSCPRGCSRRAHSR